MVCVRNHCCAQVPVHEMEMYKKCIKAECLGFYPVKVEHQTQERMTVLVLGRKRLDHRMLAWMELQENSTELFRDTCACVLAGILFQFDLKLN